VWQAQHGAGGRGAAKLSKADAALILQAVNSVMAAAGTVYSVDLEQAEELISAQQHHIYDAVLAAVAPVYESAARLWAEQVAMMEEMEAMSRALCAQAHAHGDSSMSPFQALRASPPASKLSFKDVRTSDASSSTSSRKNYGNKLVDGSSASDASSDTSDPVAKLKGHMAGKQSSPPPLALPTHEQGPGFMGRVSGALSSMFAGITGGSTRRVQRRPSGGSEDSSLLQ
jgi:hypothetical protein